MFGKYTVISDLFSTLVKTKGKEQARKFIIETFDKTFEKIETFDMADFLNSFKKDTAASKVNTIRHKDNKSYTLVVEVPGIPKSDLKVTLSKGVLKIVGNSNVKISNDIIYENSIDVTLTIDEADKIINSKLENGILLITVESAKNNSDSININID